MGNPNLRPEYNRHASLGLNWCSEGSVCVLFALFQDELRDEINGFAWNGMGFTAVNLNGESDRQGMEIQLDAEIAGTTLRGA